MSGVELSRKFTATVADYFEDMKRDYRLSVNSSILNHYQLLNEDERPRFAALQIFSKLKQETSCPRQGCVPLVFDTPFFFVRESISRTLCVAEEAFLLGLQLYYKEMDISEVSLVDPQLYRDQRPWLLENFRETQEEYIRETVEYFRNEWVPKVVGIIDELVSPTAQYPQRSMERLMNYMMRLSLTMREQLEMVILLSTSGYRKLWEQYLPSEEKVPEHQGIHRQPLFTIQLTVADNEFVFVPSLETVESTVLGIYDHAIQSIKGIEDLQSRLTTVTNLLVSNEIYTLPPDEIRLVASRKKIKEILEYNFQPARKLQEDYQEYNDLAHLNIETFAELYIAAKHSLEDYEQTITTYLEVCLMIV
ncbi:dynein heavy chain 12, axonemal-like [Selaginella moellendorffii]|uniref:dynein heavy chain 12, axonemal-like n=1 Tax=Selaginella moellendorffii TaxID=88036 RepID=UPI000D1CE626|nr:dynein heavy chain 12, axonemal-like [Selaginella moellendorffii]|eukprot:XP_024529038.1 dynein heavy chain 12, axonemal-like [Selaginella moellendorffii]